MLLRCQLELTGGEGGVDDRQVGRGHRKVAERCALVRIDLLAIEPGRPGAGAKRLKQLECVISAAGCDLRCAERCDPALDNRVGASVVDPVGEAGPPREECVVADADVVVPEGEEPCVGEEFDDVAR